MAYDDAWKESYLYAGLNFRLATFFFVFFAYAFAAAADAAKGEGKRAILAATSDGARDRLLGVLREHGLDGAFAAPRTVGATVADDLRGFGLDGMQRRAERLGGRFAMDTAAGTTVRVEIPWAHEEPMRG